MAKKSKKTAPKAKKAGGPALLYREPELAVRVIREEFNSEYRGVVIDDVRLSSGPLDDQSLLYANEDVKPSALGFWRFETKTGTMRDSSGKGRDLAFGEAKVAPSAAKTAQAPLAALCHALLNSSEFLYVE